MNWAYLTIIGCIIFNLGSMIGNKTIKLVNVIAWGIDIWLITIAVMIGWV